MRQLFQMEKVLLETVIHNRAQDKYGCLFGTETMVGHLMEGVGRSVEFSGKTGVYEVCGQREPLEQEIRDMRQQLCAR